LRLDVEAKVRELRALRVEPHLAVVLATDDESTAWYVRSISRAAAASGLLCSIVDLGPDASAEDIASILASLSNDPEVHGIILQAPLPAGVLLHELTPFIAPEKDVDGANPLSLGSLAAGQDAFAPATAEAVVALLDHHGIGIEGKHVAVVGRSVVVGKPLLHLLLERNATVTICHSRSRPLEKYTASADIVVAAVGRTHLLTELHIADQAVVIDVGTNALDDGTLAGDVDPVSAGKVASALSPVPGGVGAVTTALILQHTVQAAGKSLSFGQRPDALDSDLQLVP
jgi:methylenetetrahydrofolate dehydrogenase (NADP+) / methenyltetrahydrofolate cyclohydrolase